MTDSGGTLPRYKAIFLPSGLCEGSRSEKQTALLTAPRTTVAEACRRARLETGHVFLVGEDSDGRVFTALPDIHRCSSSREVRWVGPAQLAGQPWQEKFPPAEVMDQFQAAAVEYFAAVVD